MNHPLCHLQNLRICRWGPLFALGSLLACGCTETTAPNGSLAVAPNAQAAPLEADSSLFLADYRQAFETARRENRLVLLFFTAEWCHYCHEMEEETFADPQIRQLAREFTCVRVDADQEAKLCQQFQVTAFPTVQFVSPLGAPLRRMIGKQSADQLGGQMQEILGAMARHQRDSRLIR
ncbi:MAG: thioredoxin family protein [Planctomycetales bacterium]|nr:thioredoxin family protein [Planctomycetales bacterium]